MKKESIYLVVLGIIIIWGTIVVYFFPLLHFVLTWLIMPIITILITKFSRKIYFGILFNFTLILLHNEVVRVVINPGFDALGRDLSFISFFIESSIVCIIWGISLFTKVKRDLDVSAIQIAKTYFPFLIFIYILSLIIYTVIYRAWFFQ